jgi:ABC-2 type transport system ATP-binding protein
MLESLSQAPGGLPRGTVVALLVLVAVQVSLQVVALVDLARRPRVEGGPKWLWLVVILGGNLVGAVVYLAVGRGPRGRESDTCASGAGGRPPVAAEARSVIPLLFPDPTREPPESASHGVSPALELEGLTRDFGSFRALDHVDLVVPSGSIFGFLGPNGAGKTTTLRLVAGLAAPTDGRIRILGQDTREASDQARSRIGYLPDVPGFYPWMTGPEWLMLTGRLYGMTRAERAERAEAVLSWMGLDRRLGPIKSYSRGMKQRLGIAQALLHGPALLLLDEPTSALDPLGRKEVLDAVAALRGRTTVFFSSHILADVERVCDAVAILNHGRLVARATLEELKQRGPARPMVLEIHGDAAAVVSRLDGSPWLERLDRHGARLELHVRDVAAAQCAVPAAISDAGAGLVRLETREATLEDVFVAWVGEGES